MMVLVVTFGLNVWLLLLLQQLNNTEGVVGKIDRREILPTTTEVTTTPKAKGEVMDIHSQY